MDPELLNIFQFVDEDIVNIFQDMDSYFGRTCALDIWFSDCDLITPHSTAGFMNGRIVELLEVFFANFLNEIGLAMEREGSNKNVLSQFAWGVEERSA